MHWLYAGPSRNKALIFSLGGQSCNVPAALLRQHNCHLFPCCFRQAASKNQKARSRHFNDTHTWLKHPPVISMYFLSSSSSVLCLSSSSSCRDLGENKNKHQLGRLDTASLLWLQVIVRPYEKWSLSTIRWSLPSWEQTVTAVSGEVKVCCYGLGTKAVLCPQWDCVCHCLGALIRLWRACTYATMRSDSSDTSAFFSWTSWIQCSIISGEPLLPVDEEKIQRWFTCVWWYVKQNKSRGRQVGMEILGKELGNKIYMLYVCDSALPYRNLGEFWRQFTWTHLSLLPKVSILFKHETTATCIFLTDYW